MRLARRPTTNSGSARAESSEQLRRLAAELRRVGVADVGAESVTLSIRPGNSSVTFTSVLGDQWVGTAAEALTRLAGLEDDAGADRFWRTFYESLYQPRGEQSPYATPYPLPSAIAALILAWALATSLYWLSIAGGILEDGCDPDGSTVAKTGAVTGGVLCVVAIVAVWRRRHQFGLLLVAFTLMDAGVLSLLWFVVTPLIWGPQTCS